MREKGFIDFDQSLLIVNKEIQDIELILLSKVFILDSTFGECSQFCERFLELSGCLLIFLWQNYVHFSFLFPCSHLIFEPSLKYLFPDILNAFNEYGLHLGLLNSLIRLLTLLQAKFLL